MEKCPGSGEHMRADWPADDTPTEEFPKGYPGATVCSKCSYGVVFVRGTVRPGVSVSGYPGDFGRVRVHYVSKDYSRMSYNKRTAPFIEGAAEKGSKP